MDHFKCLYDAPLVMTDKGPVRGYHWNHVDIFKGIPYAQAKRFHAPEEVPAWKQARDCTTYGYVCPLLQLNLPQGETMVPHRYWVMNENCQNLNVWTPACDDGKRPVMIWLHGGGYTDGSAIEQLAYEGENMAHFGDVVVVSVNHRLNILGYFDLSDFGPEYENSGNAGGDDIIAALKWVNRNIEAFGGDPDNITVFGQSGGGAKVTTLLQSPDADGLFRKGIVMSGVINLLHDVPGTACDCALEMMDVLKLASIRELEEVPYALLAQAYLKVKPALEAAGKNVGCHPHANAHYAGDPMTAPGGFRKESLGVKLMVGSVFGEFGPFIPGGENCDGSDVKARALVRRELGTETAVRLLPIFEAAYPDRSPADLLMLDTEFRGPEISYIAGFSQQGGIVYSYLFDQDFPYLGRTCPWHCSDIPFAFHNTELVPSADIPGVREQLEAEVFGAYMSFAHEDAPGWAASTPGQEKTKIFSAASCVRTNFDHDLIAAAAPVLGPYVGRKMAETEAAAAH